MAEIEAWHVTKWGEDVLHRYQQMDSRLWEKIQIKDNIKGKAETFNVLEEAPDMQQVATSNQDSPHMPLDHDLRWAYLTTLSWGTNVDKRDILRVLVDPVSRYKEAAAYSMYRRKCKIIIDALTGTAMSGANGTTSNALPAAQAIAANNQGLTFDKVNEVNRKFNQKEVPEEDRIFIYDSISMEQLLKDVRDSQKDYVPTIEAMRDGRLPGGSKFMNMTWIRIEPRKAAPTAGTATGKNKHGLPYNASTDVVSCIAFSASCVGLAIGRDGEFFFDPARVDKSFNPYIYLEMDTGAVRIQDEGVVTVGCDNSPAT